MQQVACILYAYSLPDAQVVNEFYARNANRPPSLDP